MCIFFQEVFPRGNVLSLFIYFIIFLFYCSAKLLKATEKISK